MSLLVVLPFFYGDAHLLLNNLAWMKELDGKLDYDCLLSTDNFTDPEPGRALASTMFRRVEVFRYIRHPNSAWPFCQNNAFTSASWHIAAHHKRPWIWVETDSVPMCKGWLDALWADYQKGGKPFGGHWNHATNVFNGVAIYPPEVARYSENMMMVSLLDVKDASGKPHQPPWDAYGSKQVKPHLHQMNHLMQHIWRNDETGDAWTFPDRATVERVIRPGVVLFHRCKNESLIARLREAEGVNIQKAEMADVVLLRSNGDIISILPLLKRISEQQLKRPVRLAVMREYAPLLDGVSYVEAVPCDGDNADPLSVAARMNAVNAQVCGKGIRTEASDNFATKAWLLLGHQWDPSAPLVFDNRNPKREAALARTVFTTTKPKVLVKLHGHSSPFPDGDNILNALDSVSDAELVNLDSVKAERIYDILGLMDRAACCVTIDTMAIHLAQATPCPMVQLVNDTAFGASPARGNCQLRMRYAEVPKRINEIVETVKKCVNQKL